MRLGIAYVPEDRGTQGLVRPMQLRENVSLAVLARVATRSGSSIAPPRPRWRRPASGSLGIRASGIEQVVNKLSGGNQQKVVLGKWLASEPRLLILDEPTRGIDVGAKAEIHRLMSELAAQGMAILMISSELPEVLGMSDRILVMREGRHGRRIRRAAGDAGERRRRDDERPSGADAPGGRRGGRAMTAVSIARTAAQGSRSTGRSAPRCSARRRRCCWALIVLLFVVVGVYQSALPGRDATWRASVRQRLYRGGRHRHVHGDRLRQHRHLRRLR